MVGNSTTFQCRHRDGSQDEVRWEKKDGALPSDRSFVDKGVLTIRDTVAQDKGTYVCRVNTGAGDVAIEAKLEVHCKFCYHSMVPISITLDFSKLPVTQTQSPFLSLVKHCAFLSSICDTQKDGTTQGTLTCQPQIYCVCMGI